jgi:hypothetical protein
MGSYSEAWNATYETLPPDVEQESLGAGRIRDLKIQVRLRMQYDHLWAGTGDDGSHQSVTLLDVSANSNFGNTDPATPILAAGAGGILYGKMVSSIVELFYKNSAGGSTQLTSNGILNPPFASGTRLVFAQASAPVGWTQVVTNTDRVLRLVNDGTGGQTGGSWTISGNFGSTDGHALTINEMPAHTHSDTQVIVADFGANAFAAGAATGGTTGSTGGGANHDHPLTGISSDGVWRPSYLNAIICSKN